MNTYKVKKLCIGCELCTEIAPDNFAMKGDRAYVKKQPTTKAQEELCEEAEDACPVEAISHG